MQYLFFPRFNKRETLPIRIARLIVEAYRCELLKES